MSDEPTPTLEDQRIAKALWSELFYQYITEKSHCFAEVCADGAWWRCTLLSPPAVAAASLFCHVSQTTPIHERWPGCQSSIYQVSCPTKIQRTIAQAIGEVRHKYQERALLQVMSEFNG